MSTSFTHQLWKFAKTSAAVSKDLVIAKWEEKGENNITSV